MVRRNKVISYLPLDYQRHVIIGTTSIYLTGRELLPRALLPLELSGPLPDVDLSSTWYHSNSEYMKKAKELLPFVARAIQNVFVASYTQK